MVCVVEAKKDNIKQGIAQSLVGSETICDVEKINTSYAIATNYLTWCFLKNEDDRIVQEVLTVGMQDNKPTKESLKYNSRENLFDSIIIQYNVTTKVPP